MRAFEILRRGHGEVRDVSAPRPGAGQVVVEVAFVGVCGTDLGMYEADDARMQQTRNHYPLRLGHEWSGIVAELGEGVDAGLLGAAVTGETMLGCGRCEFCAAGMPNLCVDRAEIGVRSDWPGALAERLLVPASALHLLPEGVDLAAGALVEPAANSWRAVEAAEPAPGRRVLVVGSGTIGLLCTQLAASRGAEVHVAGLDDATLALAAELGATGTWHPDGLPPLRWDAVIDATDAPSVPAAAAEAVVPGGRLVLIGVAHTPSLVDSTRIVRRELTVVGILGGSQGFAPAIDAIASGAVRTEPLIGATIGLDEVRGVLEGTRPEGAGPGPKTLVRPKR